MTETVNPGVFYFIALFTLLSAVAMVVKKNLVHSALCMLLVFLGVAATYITLSADFLAAVQILVYAGAIAIFIVFGVMLTVRGDIRQSNLFSKNVGLAAIVCLGLVAVVIMAVTGTGWQLSSAPAPVETASQISDLMLSKFVVPFEVAAILLTVALLGAIIIAKEVKK
ncbi:NADH-quinone oxidoreductase subunit J [bacterium]|nr:MAG: NADH-quinone oxidoreductase subunit J [bacterium]